MCDYCYDATGERVNKDENCLRDYTLQGSTLQCTAWAAVQLVCTVYTNAVCHVWADDVVNTIGNSRVGDETTGSFCVHGADRG